jgi:ribosomal protein L11
MKGVDSRIDLILGLPEKRKSKGYQHIKFFFPAGEAKSSGSLGPVVSMFQLNTSQVCKDLNTLSSNIYPNGVPLPVKIFKPSSVGRTSTFKIVLGCPTLKYYLRLAILSTMDLKAMGIVSPSSEVDEVVPETGPEIAVVSQKQPEILENVLTDEEIEARVPKKIPISLLYDIVRAHSVNNTNKTISNLKSFAGSVFGTLSTMNILKKIDLSALICKKSMKIWVKLARVGKKGLFVLVLIF